MPSPNRHIPNYIRDAVECAVARGWSFDRIVAAGFTPAQVERVMAGMDEANAVETVPNRRVPPPPAVPHGCGTYGGYRRHQRSLTSACGPCKTAYARYREFERANRRGVS